MKITAEQLKKMIKEQIEEVKVANAEEQLRAFVDKLQGLLDTGKAHTVSELDLDALKPALRSLKSKAGAAGRSPESKLAAAQKAATTRKKNKADAVAFAGKIAADRRAKQAAAENRANRGLLPLVVTGYNGTPSPEYYEPMSNLITGPDGFSIPRFRLKRQYKNLSVDDVELRRGRVVSRRDDILNGAEPFID